MSRITHHLTSGTRRVGALALVAAALAACKTDAPTTPTVAGSAAINPALATTTGRSYYVNAATGSNANAGTSSAPFKTLGKALSVAVAGDTVRLARGKYTSTGSGTLSGDVYPLHVKSGVTIRGTRNADGSQATFLSPAASADRTTGLILDGSAKLQDMELDVFGIAIDASAGTVSMRNLNFILDRTAVRLRGTVQATLTRPYMYLAADSSTGVDVQKKARFTLDSALLEHVGNCVVGRAILAGDSTQVSVKNSTLRNFASAVRLFGASQTMISNSEIAPAGVLCPGKGPVAAVDYARLVLQDVKTQGTAATRGGGFFVGLLGHAMLQLTRVTVAWYSTAVSAGEHSTVWASYSTFKYNSRGIRGAPGAQLTVSHSTFSENDVALEAYTLKLRTSTVYGGSTGILALSGGVDLGHSVDWGWNTFKSARSTQVQFAPNPQGQDLYAVGNVWNPYVQGASPEGWYTTLSSVTSGAKYTVGPNFDIGQPFGTKYPNHIYLK